MGSSGESAGNTYKCKTCSEKGHNRRTCKRHGNDADEANADLIPSPVHLPSLSLQLGEHVRPLQPQEVRDQDDFQPQTDIPDNLHVQPPGVTGLTSLSDSRTSFRSSSLRNPQWIVQPFSNLSPQSRTRPTSTASFMLKATFTNVLDSRPIIQTRRVSSLQLKICLGIVTMEGRVTTPITTAATTSSDPLSDPLSSCS
ncbi:hypothetical protein AM588_10001335 [Phytophthora nicotianae]|uniref:CCHC-type domain-containing protein n=1 Tax=Phytophthora nicotianae TaxID=4792 RepID=A0A0W8CSC6_PHYNI|nr:hypothetical protein AM588_10001335 [Phytophthora nicotianae]